MTGHVLQHGSWRRTAMAVALCLAAIVAVWLGVRRPSPRPATWSQLMAAVDSDQPDALEHARQWAADDWPGVAPNLDELLRHPNWRRRLAACRMLATQPDQVAVPRLVARVSDCDWRVRAAASQRLGAAGAGHPLVMLRDQPVDQREQALLEWMDRYDAVRPQRLSERLCDLYAGAGPVEFGWPMIDRCLSCHAGTRRQSPQASASCVQCHAQIGEQWRASAHAQSLTHLRLQTVNPQTRQVEPVNFGDLRGIRCVECHEPAQEQPSPGPADGECAVRFVGPAENSCRRCHSGTEAQWQTWRDGPRWRMALWPPGQVQRSAAGDVRSCVDCHMPAQTGTKGRAMRDHRWAARRDVQRLRQGIAVLAVPVRMNGAAGLELKLTNLAGHDYPTGTRHRAVKLHGPTHEEGDPAAVFVPAATRGWSLTPVQTLGPGEEKRIVLPLSQGEAGAYVLRYYRDLFTPGSWTVDLATGQTAP